MTAVKRFIGKHSFGSIISVGAFCAALDWSAFLPEGWILDEIMWSAYVLFSGWMHKLGKWSMGAER